MKPRVILESPYAGDSEIYLTYSRACMRDSIARGEAPFAAHMLYTQPGVLEERAVGIEIGLIWGRLAEFTVVYTDYGVSRGMLGGIDAAIACERPVVYRSLYEKR